MIAHIPPETLEVFTRFSKLFNQDDHFGLREIGEDVGRDRFILFEGNYADRAGKNKTGKGWSIHSRRHLAAFGAMGEALERYSLGCVQPDIRGASYDQLVKKGLRCLDPESFKVFHETQNIFRSGEVFNLDRLSEVDWTWYAEPTLRSKKILLPNLFNQHCRYRLPFYFESSSSGCACAQSEVQAKLFSTYELLERDAAMFYWWTKNTPLEIDLRYPSERLCGILKPHQKYFDRIKLFYLKIDIRAVTVLATFRGDTKRNEPYFAVCGACRLDPVEAIEKALNELRHSILLSRAYNQNHFEGKFFDFNKTVWTFNDRHELYARTRIRSAYRFLFLKTRKRIHFSEIKNFSKGTTKSDLAFVVGEFAKNGHRLFFKNNTPRNLRPYFFVYRATSPDLITIDPMHRYRPQGFPRLYDLSVKLKLKRRPKSPKDLNVYPHPYP